MIQRHYEEKQLAAQQEKTEKRLEFKKQQGRLQNSVRTLLTLNCVTDFDKLWKLSVHKNRYFGRFFFLFVNKAVFFFFFKRKVIIKIDSAGI